MGYFEESGGQRGIAWRSPTHFHSASFRRANPMTRFPAAMTLWMVVTALASATDPAKPDAAAMHFPSKEWSRG